MPCLIVALLRGQWTNLSEAEVMAFEWGNRHIHAELWVDDNAFSAVAGSGADPDAGCVVAGALPPDMDTSRWDRYPVAVSDGARAVALLLEMAKTPARYNVPVRDFITGFGGEPRLDPRRPDEWGYLYCSQFVLLYLRRLSMEGLLRNEPNSALWEIPSQACLPSTLGHIMHCLGWRPLAV